MMNSVRKAIIPVAGLGTRFLPLSRVVPKELWPVAGKPMLQYIIEEAVSSGIEEIIFVISPDKKVILDYFQKPTKALEEILKERKKDEVLEKINELFEYLNNISISFVVEKEPLGDGHAVLQAKKLVGEEPCAVLFGDDIVESKTPCLAQLVKIFKTCQRPVFSLYRLPKEKLPFYGIVDVEKIASKLYKIKKVVEKPAIELAPSDLTIVGKYIITPEVFDYLKKAQSNERGEIILADTFEKMVKDGKMVYGYEFEGQWRECGNIPAYLETNIYFSSKELNKKDK